MNHFHIWCNLKAGTDARDFGDGARELLSYLHEREMIEGYSIARRGFVIAPPDLGEFHVTVEFRSIEQMDHTLEYVSNSSEEAAAFYQPLAEMIRDVSLAMDQDFPEEKQGHRTPRERGETR
jgi:hypothetical protein